jgi:hypothetical protein
MANFMGKGFLAVIICVANITVPSNVEGEPGKYA